MAYTFLKLFSLKNHFVFCLKKGKINIWEGSKISTYSSLKMKKKPRFFTSEQNFTKQNNV